jgi:hypothetical protein
LFLGELWELIWIGQKRQYDISAIDLHRRVRSVWLGIPAVIQFSELRHHIAVNQNAALDLLNDPKPIAPPRFSVSSFYRSNCD